MGDSKKSFAVLDDIVRELQQFKKSRYETAGTQIIIVDADTGEILDDIPTLKFWRKLRYFEIYTNRVSFNVGGPEIPVNYSNSPNPFVFKINYDAKINERGVFNLIRAIYQANSPTAAINDIIKEVISDFIFEKRDFVSEYKNYEKEVEQIIIAAGLKCGLKLTPRLLTDDFGGAQGDPFISCDHKVIAKTKDAQAVEIDHHLALTLTDSIKLKLSRETDVTKWAKKKLDQFTNNAIIDMNYAEVLVSMKESIIKEPMQEACRQIGYELKQLVTVPGLEIEKFYFETAEDGHSDSSEFGTKDTRLKISLNVIIDGRLDLHSEKTKKYIKPGFDIIAGMRKNVIGFAKIYINGITPDECFTERYVFEDNLRNLINAKLENEYGFKELTVTIKFLENNLSRRLSLLQERPKKVELLADWTERSYVLWFRVWGVSKDGWFRFRANNYTDTDTELNDIARLVKSGMESKILRIGDDITGKIIDEEFNTVKKRVRQEFGLEIGLHDFNENFSDQEALYIKTKKDEMDAALTHSKMIQDGEMSQLAEYLKKKEEAIESEEKDDVIKKLDEKIASFKSRGAGSKEKFLKQKTDNTFLLPDRTENSQLNSTDDNSKK